MLSRRIVAAAAFIAVANAIVFGIRAWLVIPVGVESSSMTPTLERGDRVLVNRLADPGSVSRGDIVVVDADRMTTSGTGAAADAYIIKRVIGLPGETIQGGEQIIAVNDNKRLREPYARWEDDDSTFGPVKLAHDELWVMGDQRPSSIDSRTFGPVDESAIVGRAFWIIWPPSRAGAIT